MGVTDKGDTVFDPFLGSGTMLKLCKLYRRKFIGCDINKKFVTSAVKLARKQEKITKNTIESYM